MSPFPLNSNLGTSVQTLRLSYVSLVMLKTPATLLRLMLLKQRALRSKFNVDMPLRMTS